MNDKTAAIRAYTFPKQEQTDRKINNFVSKILNFTRAIIWDTETTTDLYHNLKFGYFMVIFFGKIDYDGIFYDPAIVKGKELLTLLRFCNQNKIAIYTLEQFRKIFLKETFDLQSLCIVFNLPFDLAIIAIKSTDSRNKRKAGFS